jgi:hypothetical protein
MGVGEGGYAHSRFLEVLSESIIFRIFALWGGSMAPVGGVSAQMEGGVVRAEGDGASRPN